MKVLIACEESGRVRDAFINKGHDAISCDLLDTSSESNNHYQGDVRDIINDGWDLMIAFPPCTFLTVTGNKWFYHPEDKELPTEKRRPHPNFPNRRQDREDALEFIDLLMNSNIEKIAIENPVGVISSRIRKPDQIIQPYYFGDPFEKRTCLWLKNLPLLKKTNEVKAEERTYFKSGKSFPTWYSKTSSLSKEERSIARSKTFFGIAEAMANQWGDK